MEITSLDGVKLDADVRRRVAGPALGTVVAAHGITVDMDEGGMFVRLADRLASAGFNVVRFTFRGHGRSGGSPEGMTIAGELLDLQAAGDVARSEAAGKGLSLVAASFGAVSAALSLPWLDRLLTGVVLWNPVLDLRRTFVDPELPWGIENFGPAQQQRLRQDGRLLIDGEFPIGRVLWEEMHLYRPLPEFLRSTTPALVVHGDSDTYVSYEIARDAASRRAACEFHTVKGSGHGFDSREAEGEAIAVTVDWLADRHARAA